MQPDAHRARRILALGKRAVEREPLCLRHALTIVLNLDERVAARGEYPDDEGERAHAVLKAVLEAVFHKGLKHEIGAPRFGAVLGDLQPVLQPLAHAAGVEL